MINKPSLVTAVLAILALDVSIAEEIVVVASEVRNLGIETAAPEQAHAMAAISATARVVIPPMGEVFVSSPHSGLLIRLSVAVGDEVVKGQELAELQSPDFLAWQRDFLDALNTDRLARSELDRDRQLHEEGIISGRRLEETTTRAKIAATGVNEHRELLKIAGLTDAEIRALETEQRLLQTLAIRAPADGVVLDRMAIAGERLDEMSPVYRIADLSLLWLEISVPQEQLAAVRPGMKVAVAGRPAGQPVEVINVGRSVDPVTQAVTVRAVLKEAGHAMRPGQFVSVSILADHAEALAGPVWSVPAAAVTRSDDGHYVFVRTPAGFNVLEVLVVGADADNVYLSTDMDGDSSVAVSGVAALKALWSTQREPAS